MSIGSYVLQYSGVNVQNVIQSGAQCLITEGGAQAGFAASAVSAAELAQLKAAGVRTLAYVNLTVTDDARPYWNAAWTHDGTDTGTPTAAAPAWLVNQPSNPWGYVVDFTEPAWQRIVLNQVRDLIQRGFDGVFLDDMAQYFVSGATALTISQQASAMLHLVNTVVETAKAINPNASVVVNGTPYIVSDAVGGINSDVSQTFLHAVEGMLLERYWGISNTEEAAINYALDVIAPNMSLLALDYGGTAFQNTLVKNYATAQGIASYVAHDASYSSAALYKTASNKADYLRGTGLSDVIEGLKGNDTLLGLAGADTLSGGQGADVFKINAGDTGNTRKTSDKITDFTSGVDTLDISGFDANSVAAGNQAFKTLLSGNTAFSKAGQLRWNAGEGLLYGNTDTDKQAEFVISLVGLKTLVLTDIAL